MKYSELLKDPRWQKKRLEILQRDDWKCQKCGSKKNQLHVHHIKYIHGLLPWEYENRFLITACKNCHKEEHEPPVDEDFKKAVHKRVKKRMEIEEEKQIKKEKDDENFFNNFFKNKIP